MSYYFYIPKFIGLSFLGHLWIHLEQRGLEIWTFSVRLKTVMLHFRFPFTTSTTFCVTSFLSITAIWFGTTHQLVDWHDRHGFYSILTTHFHGNGLYSWDDHCWETLELLCWIWRFGYTIFCLGLNFLIIDPLSKNIQTSELWKYDKYISGCVCASMPFVPLRNTEMKCVQDTFYPMMILDSILFPTRLHSCIDNSHSPFNIQAQYAVNKITCEDPVFEWVDKTWSLFLKMSDGHTVCDE